MNTTELTPFYKFVRNYMMSYGYRVQAHDADDIFQRAVLKALENNDSHESPNFYGYLVFSCLNFFRDVLPKTRYDELNERNHHHRDMSQKDMDDLLAQVSQAMEELPQAQQDAVWMEFRGIDPNTAATMSGKSLNSVYIDRCRGIKALRAALTQSA